MPKIDKFLENMVSRGALILRLDPGDPPILELPGGHRVSISSVDLLGSVLDGLAKEIVPAELETSYLRGEKINFEYPFNSNRFQVLLCKSTIGTRLVVGRTVTAPSTPPSTNETGSTQPMQKLNTLLARLIEEGGSDLYLNSDEFPIIRLNGRLESLEDGGSMDAKELEETLRPFVPVKNLEAFQAGNDTEFSIGDPSVLFRMRVSLFHDSAGPSAAIRVIPKEVPDADTLGLSEPVRRLAHLNTGLVLITGPMGSGKSTTMACLLDLALRARQDYVITLQDSNEFQFAKGGCLLRQREVGRDRLRQKQALQAALRQAPDILAIGEIRDAENLELALMAAHTGRLVIAELQTMSLVDTFYFMVDAFPRESQPRIRGRIADCLRAVVGHTLLRRPNGGRVAAIESLFNNPTIASLIREGKFEEIPSAMKGGRYGQLSHNEALIQLIQAQKVDPMEAYLKCQDRESFIGACKASRIDFDPRGAGHITEV